MKKMLFLLLSGMLIASTVGLAIAEPFTPELYKQYEDTPIGQINLGPGDTVYVRLGGSNFIYTNVDFNYYFNVLNAENEGHVSDIVITPPSGYFHPTCPTYSPTPYIDDKLIAITLSDDADIGATYSVEIGAKYLDDGTVKETGIASRGLTSVPEFPTVALPVAAILGLVFVFGRRKEGL